MSKSKPHPSTPTRTTASAAERFARAVERFNAGQAAEAAALCEPIVQAQPGHAQAWQLLGMSRIVDGRPADALQPLRQALALQPRNTQLLCLLGTACSQSGQAQDAVAWFDQALAIEPGSADIWYDRGNALHALRQHDAALASFTQAVRIAPRHAHAWLNRGHALLALHRPDEAIASFERATDADPRQPRAWLALGEALEHARRLPDALACYEKAVALDADNADGWLKFGSVLQQLGRPDLALDRFRQAARRAPHSPQVLLGLAQALAKVEGPAAALAPLQQAHAADPANPAITLWLVDAMLKTSHWAGLPELFDEVLRMLRSGAAGTVTISTLAHPDASAEDLLTSNRALAIAESQVPGASVPPTPRNAAGRRLRLAYLSSDLRTHAVSHLMAGVFEAHDRSRFETFAFSTWPQADGSPERRRVQAAVEHFIDLHALGDGEAARLIARHQINILIDLNGLTSHGRPGILARRPAPVQVQYLGYPGTSGMPQIDYILGDRWVTPSEQAHAFSEHIVRLPESFQANDDARAIAPDTPSRTELGLPEHGFVFCCLNNSYKINPRMFDRWMKLLRALPQAVLWLLGDSETARQNLRAEAQARGVEPERLVFAQRRPYAQYLAQYRQADLFLDTLPFNGGTTVSDALWAGLPVLTQLGHTFAGRMAASLLDAVGLPELITRSADEYEALALRLAREPDALGALRQRLAANLATAPLFDTRRFTRHLERALEHMAARHAQGLPPESFDVADLPPAGAAAA
ncbi:MAG: tetratricopeptide repeat protein [Burkholderiales bacterium]|nr:tetratricopeptide repeat protein [Burkholderiales bacterium]MBS0401815.1 tetratricopeptide repeat protein [Pseudomonadota bacterium]MBS0414563.1 tetratricopeptide repeat protein [Pseudomonadota bacterium]